VKGEEADHTNPARPKDKGKVAKKGEEEDGF